MASDSEYKKGEIVARREATRSLVGHQASKPTKYHSNARDCCL